MTTEGEKIYSRPFHQRRLEKTAYGILAQASLEAYKAVRGQYPSNVFDVGCSSGALLYRIKELMPDITTDGCDYSVHSDDICFKGTYTELDLNKYEPAPRQPYDLIISQEVLEHIEPENTEKALQIFKDHSKPGSLLIFGAARPRQRGDHHVNCRRKRTWIHLLEQSGWKYDLTAHLAYNAIIDSTDTVHMRCRYYKRNTVCMSRT